MKSWTWTFNSFHLAEYQCITGDTGSLFESDRSAYNALTPTIPVTVDVNTNINYPCPTNTYADDGTTNFDTFIAVPCEPTTFIFKYDNTVYCKELCAADPPVPANVASFTLPAKDHLTDGWWEGTPFTWVLIAVDVASSLLGVRPDGC